MKKFLVIAGALLATAVMADEPFGYAPVLIIYGPDSQPQVVPSADIEPTKAECLEYGRKIIERVFQQYQGMAATVACLPIPPAPKQQGEPT